MLVFSLMSAARAHGGSIPVRGQYDWSNLPVAAPEQWVVWSLYPSIVLGCLAFVAAYVWMAGPGRRRWSLSAEGPTGREWRSFLIGIAIVFCSLQGPLHELSDTYLFSAHMVQHLLITLVFPPLLIRGIPSWMWKPVTDIPVLRAFGRGLTDARVAFAVAIGTLYLWHVPAMYEWAMADHNVHIVEHLMFMASAVVMWWPVHSKIEEIPPLSPGLRMVYLFILTIPMKGLGAILTVSDYILYPFYSVQPRVFGLDPMEDQRTGGLFMWLPGGLVFWFTIGYIFFTQFYADLSREREGTGKPVPV
jgi:putative membrane protein